MKRSLSKYALVSMLAAAIAMVHPHAAVCGQQPAESPAEAVRQTVQREIDAGSGGPTVMFTDRKETPHGSQTKLLVQTREGMVGMVLATNDTLLSPEQRLAEYMRLKRLASNPEELKKKQRTEKEDAERVTRIMKALPDAFLYEADGTESGTPEIGGVGEELTRLTFRPNPEYSPPSRVEQVLTGMQGVILIDSRQHRIAKINGTLNRDVNFGWGFLGHLDKGGQFLVEQAEVIKDDWEATHMQLSFTGKILLFKGLSIKSDETFSDFQTVPSSLSFAQGVELLKQRETEVAERQRRPQKTN